jgi:CubicO group peptidase (beta-lactamase class C family)
MQKDTIFRIASMTKPICGVAMMMLWEQGKWKLTDRVDQHIPQFKGLKVQAKDGALVDQATPMTMAQLMSHTAGFGVNADYEGQKFGEGDLQGMIDKLAKLPLKAQPGTDFLYGPSVNIQGYLVEKFSGCRSTGSGRPHLWAVGDVGHRLLGRAGEGVAGGQGQHL